MASESLTWMLKADTRGFKEALNDTKKQITAANKILGLFGAAFTLSAVIGWFKRTGDEMMKLESAAKSLGVSMEFMQSMNEQARVLGVGVESVSDTIRTFAKQVGLANIGQGEWYAVAEKLGVSLKGQNGEVLGLQQQMYLMMDAIKGMNNEQERAAALSKLGGDNAIKLMGIYAQGSESYKKTTEEYKDTNRILSDETVETWAGVWRGITSGGKATYNFLAEMGAKYIKGVQLLAEGAMNVLLWFENKLVGKSGDSALKNFANYIGKMGEQTKITETAVGEFGKTTKKSYEELETGTKKIEENNKALEKLAEGLITAKKATSDYYTSLLGNQDKLAIVEEDIRTIKISMNLNDEDSVAYAEQKVRLETSLLEQTKLTRAIAEEKTKEAELEEAAKKRMYFDSLGSEERIRVLTKEINEKKNLINDKNTTAVDKEKLKAEILELQSKIESIIGVKIDENNDKRKVTVEKLEKQLQLAGILRQASTGELTTYSDKELAERVEELDKQRRDTEKQFPQTKYGYQQPYDLEEADIETEMARRQAFRRGLSSYEDTKGREYEFTVAMKRLLSQNENYNAQLTESTKQTNLLERIDKNLEGRFTQ